MLKINQKVRVRENLKDELIKLGFSKYSSEKLQDKFVNTVQNIYQIWKDDEIDNQYWATIEMCVELPLQCLEEIE